jgi:drug/metabolite transporter (DMT)-like permease
VRRALRLLVSGSGLRAMVASAFLFSVMAALIKTAARRVPAVEIVFIRNVVHALLFVPVWWTTTDRTLGNGKLLLLRGLLGLCALEAYAWTLAVMPLADAWILQAMNPVFVALLAPMLLKERSAGHVWLALILGLGGAALIVRPGFHVHLWPGVVGVFGGLASGLAYMTVRLLGRTERPLTVVMAFPLVAGPLSLPFAIPTWTWPTGLEWGILVVAALAAAGGQILLTIGLKASHAAPATTATYAGFVFASLIGWLAFDEALSWQTLVGTLAIFTGVALLGRAGVTARPSGAPVADEDSEPGDDSKS